MNIKSLLLGSAAALLAVSGAKAADAVVAAEPEAVEYVRVCDVYGAGYYYIPGTETCIKIGGFVEYQFYGGSLYERNPADHLDGTANKAWSQRTRFELGVDTGAETELGSLKTSAAVNFDWANGGGTVTGLDHATISLAGLLMGKADSQFTQFLGYAPVWNHSDIIPYGPYDTNQISYTFTGGNGFAAIVGLEEGGASYDGRANNVVGISSLSGGHNYTIDSYVPHIIAGAKVVQGWGGFGVVGGYDSEHENWTVKARLDVKFNDMFSAFVMGGYGSDKNKSNGAAAADIAAGPGFNYYKPWAGNWFVMGGVSAKLNEKATLNVQATYDEAKELAIVADLPYEIVPGFKIGPEISYYDSGKTVRAAVAPNGAAVATSGTFDAWGAGVRFRRSF